MIGVDGLDHRGEQFMLKLMSRFVLEVLPYLLSTLIAAIIVPGFLISHLEQRSAVPAVKWAPRNEAMVADRGIMSVPLLADSSIPIGK
jgi:hypothetical protein